MEAYSKYIEALLFVTAKQCFNIEHYIVQQLLILSGLYWNEAKDQVQEITEQVREKVEQLQPGRLAHSFAAVTK
jgi:hypothetical protein